MMTVMVVLLDGWGWREESADNAVCLGKTPNFDRLWEMCPHAFLRTSGKDVSLPDGQMGNSEVGHLNIGAGRVVMQELPRISEAIADGGLARSPVLAELVSALKELGGVCHLMGLVSPGGVHSHQDHDAALARILEAAGMQVVVHVFTDGRDTPPQAGRGYVEALRAALPAEARIGTVSGRYYTMDRDRRWERVEKAYRVLVEAEGPRFPDPIAAIDAAYAAGITDEFLEPACIGHYSGVRDGDSLLSFNFRADRGALLDSAFDGFRLNRQVRFAAAVGMNKYSVTLDKLLHALFPPQSMQNLLGEVVAAAGRKQLRMAETEKYPHVTCFLNGGKETPNPGEDRILVPSPKVATYDLQPEMSAPELTDKAVAQINSGKYDLVVLNYANPEMVGHTSSLEVAIKAVRRSTRGWAASWKRCRGKAARCWLPPITAIAS